MRPERFDLPAQTLRALPRRASAFALCLLVAGCASKGGGESAAESSAPTQKSSAKTGKPRASAEASAARPPASGSARPAEAPEGSLDAATFCARAVKLSEANAGKCTVPEQENLSAPQLESLGSLRGVKKQCEVRVTSAKVTFDSKAAFRCIEAAEKRGGLMTFYRFSEIPECHGVLVGTVGEGQPALYAEECAPGLARVKNRCVKPGAKNARCEEGPRGVLGAPAQHPQCEEGLACLYTVYPYEGDRGELHCLAPTPVGGACRMRGRDPRLVHLCPPETTSCYQGKCRELAAEGGECMSSDDCGPKLQCKIAGGVFGKCVPYDYEKCLADR